MPFNYRLFARLIRTSWRESTSPKRRKLLVFIAVVVPLLVVINSLCLWLDYLLFPGFRRVRVKQPIFIIGHARSGTSMAHRLLCADSDRFSWVMMYEMIVPSIVQRKLIRGIAALDRKYWNSSLTNRVHAWEDRVFAKGRQMHPMNLDGPEEDEFLLFLTFYSSTASMIFPRIREVQRYAQFDQLCPEHEQDKVLRFYRRCVQRTLYLNGPEKIHLSKNPLFSLKVESLKREFPDARFIVILRNPLETIPSILKMMTRNWKASDCPPELVQDSLEAMKETAPLYYNYPEQVRPQLSPDDWITLQYDDLLNAPQATITGVYEHFNLPLDATMQARLQAEQEKNRKYRAEHLYNAGEFGLTFEEIRQQMPELFARYGWPAPEAAASMSQRAPAQ